MKTCSQCNSPARTPRTRRAKKNRGRIKSKRSRRSNLNSQRRFPCGRQSRCRRIRAKARCKGRRRLTMVRMLHPIYTSLASSNGLISTQWWAQTKTPSIRSRKTTLLNRTNRTILKRSTSRRMSPSMRIINGKWRPSRISKLCQSTKN